MRAGDRTAALGFYSEAIRIASPAADGGGGLTLFGPDGAPSGDSAAAVAISPDEVAKLHANRCACFLALEEPARPRRRRRRRRARARVGEGAVPFGMRARDTR